MRNLMVTHKFTAKPKPKPKDVTPAQAPTNVAWSSPTPDSLLLSWTSGKDSESAILRHEYSVNGSPAITADRPNGTTIKGLTRRTDYEIRVRAVSSGGASPWMMVKATTEYALTLDGFPQPFDDVDADIRPQSGVVWQKIVAKDGSGDYTDLKKAVDEAHYAVNNRTFGTRAVILVRPGVYIQTDVTLYDYVAVIGQTGRAQDVVIVNQTVNDPNLGRGAIDTWGSTYVAHVTLRRVDVDYQGQLEKGYPKYAVHGTSGKCGIWVNCIFDVSTSTNAIGVPSVFGQDGGPGNYTLFYSCRFIGNRNDANTNIHGGANTVPDPETVVYVNCTMDNSHLLDETPNRSNEMSLGFKPLDDSRTGDTLWIVNCSGLQFAEMLGGAGGVVHKPADLPMTKDSNPGTIDSRQDWPRPLDWKL